MDFEEKNIFEKSSLWREFFQYIWTIFSFEKWTVSFGMTLKNLNEILDLGKMQKKKKINGTSIRIQWWKFRKSIQKYVVEASMDSGGSPPPRGYPRWRLMS